MQYLKGTGRVPYQGFLKEEMALPSCLDKADRVFFPRRGVK